MNRPEFLNTVTIGQTRQKYKDNVKALDNIFLLVSAGSLEEIKEIAGEWAINQAMAEMIIQQEYIREREKANWGWDRGVVDFSKQGSCILNCNNNA
jgi:hypothetical protein